MAENGRRKRDDAFMLALASGQTVRDAACAAGIGERTATRRVADLDFRRRVEELRSEMVAQTLGRLAAGMAEAADRLRALLGAKNEHIQLGAARSLLELALTLRKNVETEERLRALEKKLRSKG
jgi:hypothetical protein